MFFYFFNSIFLFFKSFVYNHLTLLFYLFNFFFFFIAVRRLSLNGFFLECVKRARLFVDRSFHSLVTFHRLVTWGLGPEPSLEALAHELTIRRHEFLLKSLFEHYLSITL